MQLFKNLTVFFPDFKK